MIIISVVVILSSIVGGIVYWVQHHPTPKGPPPPPDAKKKDDDTPRIVNINGMPYIQADLSIHSWMPYTFFPLGKEVDGKTSNGTLNFDKKRGIVYKTFILPPYCNNNKVEDGLTYYTALTPSDSDVDVIAFHPDGTLDIRDVNQNVLWTSAKSPTSITSTDLNTVIDTTVRLVYGDDGNITIQKKSSHATQPAEILFDFCARGIVDAKFKTLMPIASNKEQNNVKNFSSVDQQ